MSDLYSTLSSAVSTASAIRLTVNLKPANADGLVFPPTYDQGQHIFRPAWIDGEKRDAVLLDSVQSQANRVEMAVLDAHRRNFIRYPDIELVIPAETGEERYSVLQLSHRIYDATLRLTTIDGVPFAKSEIGMAIYAARAEKAEALYSHAPITLALGGWDSHGGGGPLVAKLPRLLTSEIVGLDALPIQSGAVKFDPMDIRKDAGPLYQSKDPDRLFEVDEDKKAAPRDKGVDPSVKGFGSVPNLSERGAVITEAIQTSIVSCSGLRRLRFGDNDDGNHACQTTIAALGLYGLLAQMDAGYNLRSGCELFPTKSPEIEIIGRALEDTEIFPITSEKCLEALEASLEAASKFGFQWRQEPLIAYANKRLTTLVNRSRNAKSGE
ncbi:hypothetical protein D3OALGA1CA_1514 [Olavius algarvensis associated proteobacterium Delta 3]|nr:hypothetical protein D3OALGB2SA_315 [Olavius algarvensis associated proteobacterium Delta 3]CAB5102313.1 hypothetical protein D3OALGA1CA_1514 [Olavius algarvensis associated proteobacterium Delta 3]